MFVFHWSVTQPQATDGEASLLPVTSLLYGAATCLESNFRAATESSQPSQHSSPLNSGNVINSINSKSASDLRDELCSGQSGSGHDSETLPAVTLLRSLAEACRTQEEHLESEKKRLEKELSEAYDAVGQSEYQLFGVWVHQGQDARSGHYLAFLKDWLEDRWIRFSDSSVSFVTWEEVRSAAVGASGRASDRAEKAEKAEKSEKSSSSAYVLVYMEASLVPHDAQGCQLPISSELYEEIKADNIVLQNERGSWEQQVKTRELRQHAQAIFQHYAGLLHRWEPRKQLGDAAGNPHDPNHRKMLNDPVP